MFPYKQFKYISLYRKQNEGKVKNKFSSLILKSCIIENERYWWMKFYISKHKSVYAIRYTVDKTFGVLKFITQYNYKIKHCLYQK